MEDEDGTWVIGNHGNTCSLSNCRPPQCWMVSITASLSAPFLPSFQASSAAWNLESVQDKPKGSSWRRPSRSTSGHRLISLIDSKNPFPLFLHPQRIVNPPPPFQCAIPAGKRLQRGKSTSDSSASALGFVRMRAAACERVCASAVRVAMC